MIAFTFPIFITTGKYKSRRAFCLGPRALDRADITRIYVRIEGEPMLKVIPKSALTFAESEQGELIF